LPWFGFAMALPPQINFADATSAISTDYNPVIVTIR
jgi:hypothetical protein